MSNELFKNKWQEAVNDLMEQMQLEGMALEEQSGSSNNKRSVYEQFQYFAQLYIKYIEIYKKLEDCYDNMVHPQKRLLLKDMLENTMVRMCETKRALVQTNTHSNSYQADFVNLDELIMDLKLTPDALEVPIPRFFKREEDFRRLDERNQIVDKLLLDFHETSAPEEEVLVDKPILEVNIEIMICLIQKNERGRQGIDRANLVKLLRKQDIKKQEKTKKIQEGMVIAEETERDDAALVLQKYWRGFKGRETVSELREDEFLFLGMKRQAEDSKDQFSQFSRSQQQHERMLLVQNEHQKEYTMALDNLKSLVVKNEGPEIKERKLRERKEWIEKYLDKTENKQLPTKAIDFHNKETMYPLSGEEQEALAKKKDDKKAPSKDKKKDKKGAEDEKKEENLLSLDILMKLNQQIQSYQKSWGVINESENFQQRYVTEVAMQEKRPEVEQELDLLVDQLIEIELDNRHLFLFGKARKKKKEKKVKPKKPKKKKVPGMGLVKGRNPLDLLSELVEAGIVKKLMPAKLSDLKGDHNVLGCVQERQFEIMPDPSMAQLRQVISEYIAIPLGSQYAKSKLEKMSYFLFYGPQGTGKTLAVRALADECNALVVDISPSNIENKATDKSAIAKTFYMAFTVAKEFQPSIIYMDDIHQVLGAAKKKKGQAQAAWTKLKKPLQDFKKAKYLEPTDRVVFIGCSNKPLECVLKDTRNFFEKKFFFPLPNYATRQLLFKGFIEQKGIELPYNFPLNTLAHITAEYPAGSVYYTIYILFYQFKQLIDQVVSQRRIERLKEEPLKFSEFLPPLSKAYFIFRDEYEKIRIFMDDVTGMKERRNAKAEAQNTNQKNSKKGKK